LAILLHARDNITVRSSIRIVSWGHSVVPTRQSVGVLVHLPVERLIGLCCEGLKFRVVTPHGAARTRSDAATSVAWVEGDASSTGSRTTRTPAASGPTTMMRRWS